MSANVLIAVLRRQIASILYVGLILLVANNAFAQESGERPEPPKGNTGGKVWTPPVRGGERILNYDVAIKIAKDASIVVTEIIRVNARGLRIKRGIFRDIPTDYRHAQLKHSIRVGIEILDITRDGRAESWRKERKGNGIRIYIGDPNRFIGRRVHTYKIRYRVARALGFYDKHDELYWNAIGHGWVFTIERANVVVELPPGAKVGGWRAWTGRQGQRGRNFDAKLGTDGRMRFTTTAMLLPRQGMTIAVKWAKGFVTPPSSGDRFAWFLKDNIGVLLLMLGTLILVIYYLIAWIRVGRDPVKGAIIPRFEPPKNFSPAACRFVSRMGFDKKSFAAAILSMGVKGFLTIKERGKKKYTLERTGAGHKKLSRGERRVAKALFKNSDKIKLEQTHHARIGRGIENLKESLIEDFEVAYFLRNRGWFYIGLAISLATALLAGLFADLQEEGIFILIWLVVWTIGLFVCGGIIVKSWRAGNRTLPILFGIIYVPFVIAEFGVLYLASTVFSAPGVAALVILAGVNVLFSALLKAPTREGQRVLDEIEGFKMYLTVAEKDRLNLINPPDRTPELFERFLPFALALEVENKWSEQFADVLAATGADGQAYHPVWYVGYSWGSMSTSDFTSSLSGSFSSAIASASTAPGSSGSSGFSSGGGFSGGGGGGGGGGGW